MCVICMIGIHTLVCKPIYACKLKLQWVIHYHNHNHIPSGCSRHGFSLILGITHLSSQSTLTHMLSLSTLLQMHLSIHTSPLPPTHTHTQKEDLQSHMVASLFLLQMHTFLIHQLFSYIWKVQTSLALIHSSFHSVFFPSIHPSILPSSLLSTPVACTHPFWSALQFWGYCF